ncbi:hypothetical protein [Pseudoxanthomonas koreensis]|uniref:hypothetical protein n=1 Tax=Pseudoxanthomonas koreensis TaxID=266061 RepID=UPI0035A719A1
MPAITPSRQPGAPTWFSGHEGQWLLAAERRWLASRLEARPAQAWLWVAPVPAQDAALPSRRGLLLHPQGAGYAGSVHCRLPLPLPSECLGDVILQHPPQAGLDELIEECCRVLVDGGRLWLCVANPCSPFRWRGTGADWAMSAPAHWRRQLARAGLSCVEPRFIGPRWKLREPAGADGDSVLCLRATCMIEAEKRVALPLSPAPMRWRHGAAPAA